MYFARRRCIYADELVDETINRVIGKVDEPIENKMGYCYGVARNVYLESLRKERLHVDIDEVSVAAAPPPAEKKTSRMSVSTNVWRPCRRINGKSCLGTFPKTGAKRLRCASVFRPA